MKTNDGIWELPPYSMIEDLEPGDQIGYEIPPIIDRKEIISLLLELMRQRVAKGLEFASDYLSCILEWPDKCMRCQFLIVAVSPYNGWTVQAVTRA